MPAILFICTANVRRSPLAEVLFADWLRQMAIPGEWRVSSAGTWAVEGIPAAAYACEVAAERGLDLSRHRARRVDEGWLAAADRVVCMTHSHTEALQAEFPAYADRVVLFQGLIGQPYDVRDVSEEVRSEYLYLLQDLTSLVNLAGPKIVALATNRQDNRTQT